MDYRASAISAAKAVFKNGAPIYVRRSVPASYDATTGKNAFPGALLNGSISATDTIITLMTSTGAWLNVGGVVKVGSEYIYYAYKQGSQLFECMRGYAGSTPAIQSTGSPVTLTFQDFLGYSIIGGYSDFFINGTSIKAGDKKFTVPASGLACIPNQSDKIVDPAGTAYTIINVEQVAPGGVTILYKVQGRK